MTRTKTSVGYKREGYIKRRTAVEKQMTIPKEGESNLKYHPHILEFCGFAIAFIDKDKGH